MHGRRCTSLFVDKACFFLAYICIGPTLIKPIIYILKKLIDFLWKPYSSINDRTLRQHAVVDTALSQRFLNKPYFLVKYSHNNHGTLVQSCFNAGSGSQTLGQHKSALGQRLVSDSMDTILRDRTPISMISIVLYTVAPYTRSLRILQLQYVYIVASELKDPI